MYPKSDFCPTSLRNLERAHFPVTPLRGRGRNILLDFAGPCKRQPAQLGIGWPDRADTLARARLGYDVRNGPDPTLSLACFLLVGLALRREVARSSKQVQAQLRIGWPDQAHTLAIFRLEYEVSLGPGRALSRRGYLLVHLAQPWRARETP